jgi:probable phosphoglycerate mutase
VPDTSSRTYRQLRVERRAGSTEIYLVRHGESAEADPAHPFALVDGRGDPALSPEGVRQAAALARRLGGIEFAAVYVTPLRRTAETAAPLLAATGLAALVEPRLVEVHMGEWEGGLYRKMITEAHPLAVRLLAEQRWDVVPGGESNDALAARTTAAIDDIAATHPDQRVVVFSHAVAISAVLARATGAAPFAFIGADNASISVVVRDDSGLFLRRFNDVAHLEATGSLSPG